MALMVCLFSFCSDVEDIVCIVGEAGLVLRREAGLPGFHATSMSLGNKIKPWTCDVFTACLRNTAGTDNGVIICPSGLFCLYSPRRFRDICEQGLWR